MWAGSDGRARGAPGAGSQAAGLCDTCAHQQVVRNTRGSSFSLCRRSREDPSYPRYPRLPVLSCEGHERREPGRGEPERDEDGRGEHGRREHGA
jgi:hypothetical protein